MRGRWSRKFLNNHCGNLSNLRVDEITTEHVLALAHDPGSASERAYRRDLPVSKLRQLFAAWDAYLAPRPDNVVQLRSA
jgi:hypothetical protein